MKADSALQYIPVIVISALDEMESELRRIVGNLDILDRAGEGTSKLQVLKQILAEALQREFVPRVGFGEQGGST